jgi:copper homeostasis protein (lipoprotein)
MSPGRGAPLLAAALVSALIAACAGTPMPPSELTETYWRPVEIEGKPVPLQTGAREPHIVLQKEGSRLQGYAGCNSMAGGYTLSGDALRFGPMAMTRRACVGDHANALESAFVAALGATASYRVNAASLELRDAEGKLRIRLEARKSQ